MPEEMDIRRVNAAVKVRISHDKLTKKCQKLRDDMIRLTRNMGPLEYNEFLKRVNT